MRTQAIRADDPALTYIAKADAFEEIMSCVAAIEVPPSVWHEAVEEGERVGAPEVPRIRDAESRGILRRVELDDSQTALAASIAAEHRLGRGESEVLALAQSGGHVIVDEGRAARAARGLGIVPVSTLFLPVLGRRSGRLSTRAAIALLRKLAIPTGASADVVFAIEDALEKEKL